MNQREIKFRAWDKNKKVIIPVRALRFEEKWNYSIREIWTPDEIPLPLDYFELMQFTGLKDSKGKEIYEGDIVKDHSGKIFIQGLCGTDKILKQSETAKDWWFSEETWYEVIGNIYENLNLLK